MNPFSFSRDLKNKGVFIMKNIKNYTLNKNTGKKMVFEKKEAINYRFNKNFVKEKGHIFSWIMGIGC